MKQKFETYEEVSQYLLNEFASEFGLSRVEGAQTVKGQRSGTNWRLDAKGVKKDGVGFVIIECRRYTTTHLDQESLGAIAYRILDTGAEGGIVVSPLDVQKGAKLVAAAEGITAVQIAAESTIHEYVLTFLNKMMIGLCEKMPGIQEGPLSMEIIYEDGRRESHLLE